MRVEHRLGAHCSAAGGLHLAIERIIKLKGKALQLFTRNQRQWKARPLEEQEIVDFRQAWKEWGNYPILSHDSYLINLASPENEIRQKSVQAFVRELQRCALLGIKMLVTHPGAHRGQGTDQGIKTYAHSLDESMRLADELCPESREVVVLLETTSGQGTCLGGRFQELASIIRAGSFPERLGVCFDTCHAFAAGYDLRDPEAYQKTMNELDSAVGLKRVQAIHLNDSRYPLGSRGDRHEHIGEGYLGMEPFRLIINDPCFSGLPMVIETPKDKAGKWDRKNLNILRFLASS